jgi:hypothetical protein
MENSTDSTQASPNEPQLPYAPDLSSNNLTQPIPAQQSAAKPNYWKIATGILGLILVSGGLAFAYTLMKKPVIQTTTAEATPSVQPITSVNPTPSDPTANWRTYTNQSFGVSVKYPPNWKVTEDKTGGGQTGQLNISEPEIPTGSSYYIGISIENSKYSTIDEYAATFDPAIYKNKTMFLVDGKSAVRFNGIFIGDVNQDMIFVLSNNKIYSIRFPSNEQNPNYPNALVGNQVVSQMLPTLTFMNQSQADSTASWRTYSKNGFSFKYPKDIKLTENSDNSVDLSRDGPTQQQQTESTDGIGILFVPRTLSSQTLEQWVDKSIADSIGVVTVSEGKKSVSLNSYSGFTYTITGLGTQRNTILQSPFSPMSFVQIINSTQDPTNKGFDAEVNQVLATFKFTN